MVVALRHFEFLVLLATIGTISHSATPGATSSQSVIPLYASGPRALAMLTLGDGAPSPVVFDTGEDKAFLTTAFSRQRKLAVIGSSTSVDEATGKRSAVPLVRLEAPKLSGIPATLGEADLLEYDESDMVGVVGPNMFAGQLVTLELCHNRLRVAPLSSERVPRAPSTPYFHHLPALNINVTGVPVLAHLDSGANGGLSLSRDLMGKVKLKRPATVIGQARSVSGVQEVYGSQIEGDVKIGPLVLHDPEVTFMGSGERGNVGYQILRQLTLVMDPAGQRSWVLDPADLSQSVAQFAGKFGPRTLRAEKGKLIYQLEGRPPFELKYLGGDLFEMAETGDRVQFLRGDGRVVGFELITAQGVVVPVARTS